MLRINSIGFNWFERITRFYSTLLNILPVFDFSAIEMPSFVAVFATKKRTVSKLNRFDSGQMYIEIIRTVFFLPSSFCTSIYYIKAFFCLFCKAHFSSRWLNAYVIRFIKSFIIAAQSMWFTLYTAFQFVNIDSHSYFNGSYQWMVSFSSFFRSIFSVLLISRLLPFPLYFWFFSSSHCCISVWCLFIVYLCPFRYSFITNGTK